MQVKAASAPRLGPAVWVVTRRPLPLAALAAAAAAAGKVVVAAADILAVAAATATTDAGGGGGSYVDGSASSVTMTAGANGSTTLAGDGVVATALDGFININGTLFSYTGSIQDWIAPLSGGYAFIVDGAQGGQGSADVGGYGTEVTGTVFLTAGESSRSWSVAAARAAIAVASPAEAAVAARSCPC